MICERDVFPVAPVGERVLLLPDPPAEETEGGLHIPDVAKHKPYAGTLVDAGLQAMDKLYDNGIELGDHVWWGKFAGVIEEWDHIVEDGDVACSGHSWDRKAAPRILTSAFECSTCHATRLIEPLIVANVDDLLGSVELAQRRRRGRVKYERGACEDGATQHYIERTANSNGHAEARE